MSKTILTEKKTDVNNKLTAREKKVAEINEKRLSETEEKITDVSGLETILNIKAREAMKLYDSAKEKQSDCFGFAVMELSAIITFCRLNTLLSKESTWRKEFKQFKIDVSRVKKLLENKSYIDVSSEVIEIIRGVANCQGSDICSDVYTKIFEQLETFRKKGIATDENTLLAPFAIVDEKSIFYKNGDVKPKTLWKYENTNIVREGSKTASKTINSERAIRDQLSLYDEIDCEYTDENGDKHTARKYEKISELAAVAIRDYNNKEIAVVADSAEHLKISNLFKACHFTAPELEVLKKHYLNHAYTTIDQAGNKYIKVGVKSLQQLADEKKVSLERMEYIDRALRKKVVRCEEFKKYFGNIEITSESKVQENKKISVFVIDEISKKEIFVDSFNSLGECAKVMEIDKSNISKVLKGKRKQIGKYTFKLA